MTATKTHLNMEQINPLISALSLKSKSNDISITRTKKISKMGVHIVDVGVSTVRFPTILPRVP
jgi:hypothetical protein